MTVIKVHGGFMKILIVAPCFSPVSSVGAVRMTSLAKYLSTDHSVSVFTINITDLKRECSHALKSTPPPNIQYLFFSLNHINQYPYHKTMKSIQNQLEDYLKKYSFDIALVSCGPVYTEGIIYKVCTKYSLPYVIDFRDLDLLDYYFNQTYKNPLYRVKHVFAQAINKRAEGKACRFASKIVVANPNHAQMLSRTYNIPFEKITAILNGYDDVRFDAVTKVPISTEHFVIGCFGKLYEYDKDRTLHLLKIVERANATYGNIYIKHVGEGRKSIEQMMIDNNINPQIYHGLGVMDYDDGIAEMSSCNMFAMLWVHPNSLSTKIFDYLALNKPILSISPKGTALEEMIQHYDYICFSEDDDKLLSFIDNIITNSITTVCPDMNASIYARSRSNKAFEDLLLSVGKENHD